MAHKYVFIELIQWTITVPLLLFILHMEEGNIRLASVNCFPFSKEVKSEFWGSAAEPKIDSLAEVWNILRLQK